MTLPTTESERLFHKGTAVWVKLLSKQRVHGRDIVSPGLFLSSVVVSPGFYKVDFVGVSRSYHFYLPEYATLLRYSTSTIIGKSNLGTGILSKSLAWDEKVISIADNVGDSTTCSIRIIVLEYP